MEQDIQKPADVEAASVLNAAPAEAAPEPVAAESAPVEAAPAVEPTVESASEATGVPAPVLAAVATVESAHTQEKTVDDWLRYIPTPRDITHMSESEIHKEYDHLLAVADHFRDRITPAIARRYSALSDAIAEIRSVRETLGIRTD